MLSQIIAVTGVNIRSIRERLSSSIVAMIGICGVVVVFIGVLSIAEGLKKAMAETGDPQTVIVMRSGSDTEMTSGLDGDAARIIQDAPGIMTGKSGPVASAELFVIVNHPRKTTGTDANVPLRGVSAGALDVRPEVKIVEGRMFEQGRNEIIAGRAAARQFANLSVGRIRTAGLSGQLSVV
jgi:putative ABC transport system permease protein